MLSDTTEFITLLKWKILQELKSARKGCENFLVDGPGSISIGEIMAVSLIRETSVKGYF